MRLEVAVFGGGVRPSEEGSLSGVEVGFTPGVMRRLPQLSPVGISARASGPSGNRSS